jgi:hypothetical protein
MVGRRSGRKPHPTVSTRRTAQIAAAETQRRFVTLMNPTDDKGAPLPVNSLAMLNFPSAPPPDIAVDRSPVDLPC